MKHIKQNDEFCLPIVQKIGCFLRSCGLLAELQTGKFLTAKQINDTWNWAKNTARIDGLNNVRDSASIATRFLRELDDNGRFVEVGKFENGATSYYPAFVNTSLARCDFLIQKIKTNGKEGTHFRVVDKAGNLIEDPHEPPIKSQGVFYSILYAYIPSAEK